jgi:signal transduction histidine kinase
MLLAVSKSIETNETQQLEFRGQKWLADKYYLMHIRPVLHLNRKKLLNITVTQFTEMERAKKENQDQLELLDMVLDGTRNGIILTDGDNIIEYCNRYFALLFHLDIAKAIGSSLFDFFDSSQQEIIEKETEKRIKGQTTSFELVYSSQKEIKDTFLVFSSPRFDLLGNFLGSFQSFSNITKYKELEKTITDDQSKLRELSKYLLMVREEERLYLSREIHDEIGQQLTAVLMSLKHQKSRPSLSEELAEGIDRNINVIQEMLTRTKSLAGLLYPIMLDDLGLIASIEWLCEEMIDKSKIPVFLKISGNDDSLNSKVKITVYRLFQEALSNAVRYSESRDIQLTMEILPENIRGFIIDKGIGFRNEDTDENGFYGIIGMEERVKSVKGILEITSRPEQGTTVKFLIPLLEN